MPRPPLTRTLLLLAALCTALSPVATALGEDPPPASQPAGVTREQAIKAADALLKERNIEWGAPTRVERLKNGGWHLFYATPEDEIPLTGPRSVMVSPEGKASLPMRL